MLIICVGLRTAVSNILLEPEDTRLLRSIGSTVQVHAQPDVFFEAKITEFALEMKQVILSQFKCLLKCNYSTQNIYECG